MIHACLEFLIGCLHRNQTRPFTLNNTCYTVCLNCGRELPYSWHAMRPLNRTVGTNSPEENHGGMSAAA